MNSFFLFVCFDKIKRLLISETQKKLLPSVVEERILMFQDCGVVRVASGHYSSECVCVGSWLLKVQNLS